MQYGTLVLPHAQSKDIERVQKRCMRIINIQCFLTMMHYLQQGYTNLVFVLKAYRIVFKEIQQPTYILNNLLLLRTCCSIDTRDKYLYSLTAAKTNCYSTSLYSLLYSKKTVSTYFLGFVIFQVPHTVLPLFFISVSSTAFKLLVAAAFYYM
jgi:hypothetical protein